MASKRKHDTEKADEMPQLEPRPDGELILPYSAPVGEVVFDEQTTANELLQQCCAQFLTNYEQYVAGTVSLLGYALEIGRFAVLMKEIVGHGNFRPFCKSRFRMISFRRIEQFVTLAESREDLLELLRNTKAQRGALLTDDQLLASTSIRKAQRLLSGPTDDSESTKRKTKKRGKPASNIVAPADIDDALTPEFIVDVAQNLFGQVDLDPCASDRQPDHVRAILNWPRAKHGNIPSARWEGRVFVHPPLTWIETWIDKAKFEFQRNRLTEGLLLVPARTDAAWFLTLAEYPRAFFRERLSFASADNNDPITAHEPYVIVYLGPTERTAAFATAFSRWADAFLPVATSRVPKIEATPE